jgi:hypothetical protein
MRYRHLLRAFALACAATFAGAVWLAPLPAIAADAPAKSGSEAPASIKSVPPPTAPADTAAAASPEPRPDGGKKQRNHSATIEIDDSDFDSAMGSNPAFVLAIVAIIMGSLFLSPVLIAFAIIWYKLRKNRLDNEAMIKLAEKGVMPQPQTPVGVAAAAAPAQAVSPVYQQALTARKRAVWSDLRKGVLMLMIGLALTFYSMTGDGTPNWVGLVLLFVGLGYVALWWLEGRHLDGRAPGGADDNSVT